MRRHLVRTLLLAALVPALLVSGAVQAKPRASGKKAATSSVPAANNKKKPADIKLKPDETQDIGEQQQAQTNSPPPRAAPPASTSMIGSCRARPTSRAPSTFTTARN
ncbi:MAG: hypothetical protein ACJ790_17190 [Myxococcaceae bacterium]